MFHLTLPCLYSYEHKYLRLVATRLTGSCHACVARLPQCAVPPCLPASNHLTLWMTFLRSTECFIRTPVMDPTNAQPYCLPMFHCRAKAAFGNLNKPSIDTTILMDCQSKVFGFITGLSVLILCDESESSSHENFPKTGCCTSEIQLSKPYSFLCSKQFALFKVTPPILLPLHGKLNMSKSSQLKLLLGNE